MAIKKKVVAPKKAVAKKPAAKAGAAMTPLEKARAARAANAAAGKKPGVKKPASGKRTPPKKFTFKAPEGVKSFFAMAMFKTAKDGLLSPGARLVAIKGKWDNENAPRYDLTDLDPATVTAFYGRFMNILYASNPVRRLPGNKGYMVLLRVGVASADGMLRCGIKSVWYMTPEKKKKLFTDKTNPELRKIRRTGKLLAGAFTRVPDMNELKARQKEHDASQETSDEE